MESSYAKNEKEYIREYEKRGYSSNFYYREGKLINSDTKKAYRPEQMYVVAEHRYEGMSNPSDMSILYVLETEKEEKGTFLAGYGPNADPDTAEFFKAIPDDHCSNDKNIDFEND
jgi:hypothetical protein